MKMRSTQFIRFFAFLFFLQILGGTTLNFSSSNLQNQMSTVGLGWDLILNGPTIITAGGLYRLAENTTGSIFIDADDVLIDLQGAVFSGNNNPVIGIAAGHKNIKIVNGCIRGTSQGSAASGPNNLIFGLVGGHVDFTKKGMSSTNIGIFVDEGCQLITLKDLIIFDCNDGINFFGGALDAQLVKSCEIENCELRGCNTGVSLAYTKKIVLKNCTASNCINAGFAQEYSKYNVFDKCYALETMNGTDLISVFGFYSFSGQGNLFNECVAEGTTKDVGTYTNYLTRAVGFYLFGTEGAMERDTKIINSVANTTLVSTYSSDAYGILVEPVLLAAALDPIASYTNGATVASTDWAPDGKYLAIGGVNQVGTLPEVRVLKFEDRSLSAIASYDHGTSVNSVNWSPCGKYLAIGGFTGTDGNHVIVLRFDGSNLTVLAGYVYGAGNVGVFSVNWSPCGKYLAIGGVTNGTTEVSVLKFDGSVLSLITNLLPMHGADIFSVNWSPDGKYLAIGGDTSGTDGNQVRVLKFDGSNLTVITSFIHGDVIRSVNWSPDGKYLAIGGDAGTEAGFPQVVVLRFDGTPLTPSLVLVASYVHGATINSVYWAPCGLYLAIGGVAGTETGLPETVILYFDGTPVMLESNSYHRGANINSVVWSPDSLNLAIGGFASVPGGYEESVFNVMDAPSGCLLQNNKVCNATLEIAGVTPDFSRQAIGICASGKNLYVKNVGSYNDINFNKALYNVYGASLLTCNPREFDNLWQPPYEACFGYSVCCS